MHRNPLIYFSKGPQFPVTTCSNWRYSPTRSRRSGWDPNLGTFQVGATNRPEEGLGDIASTSLRPNRKAGKGDRLSWNTWNWSTFEIKDGKRECIHDKYYYHTHTYIYIYTYIHTYIYISYIYMIIYLFKLININFAPFWDKAESVAWIRPHPGWCF
jgi:hypothetical protein